MSFGRSYEAGALTEYDVTICYYYAATPERSKNNVKKKARASSACHTLSQRGVKH